MQKAMSYAGRTRRGELVNEINDIEDTSYVHTGLTNLLTHRYRVVAETSGGRGPESLQVLAVPGPVPGTVEWAAVINKDPGHEIHYASATNATIYRILISAAEDSLAGRRPLSPFIEDATSPVLRPAVPVLTPSYYRVIAMNDSRIGFGGPVIVSPTHVVATVDLPRLGAAFGDSNDDTCLDLVSAVQTRTNDVCTGAFTARDLTTAGLAGLVAAGRTNGDSRFADFNGDGHDDLFSSTASLATAAGSTALLHLNQANGNFQAAPGVTALAIGGFGGTLLTADFNNDGDVDVFAPNDQTRGDGARNWLLLNDGAGIFTDVAAAAGAETNPAGAAFVPRGGQAADFNEDGFIDLIFGSRLLTNNGDGTFTDGSASAGIPVRADQGLKLIDADLDGDLDLVHHDGVVTRLHRNNAGVFDAGATIFEDTTRATFGLGLNVCDVNSDGFDDVLIANSVTATGTGVPKLLVNVNGTFIPSALPKEVAAGTNNLVAANDLIACGELDRSGVIDVVARWGTTYRVLRAASALSTHIEIRVLGGAGERNQQGRIVKITPRIAPQPNHDAGHRVRLRPAVAESVRPPGGCALAGRLRHHGAVCRRRSDGNCRARGRPDDICRRPGAGRAAIGGNRLASQPRACVRSSIRSAASSMPIERRTSESLMPSFARASGGTEAWVMIAG